MVLALVNTDPHQKRLFVRVTIWSAVLIFVSIFLWHKAHPSHGGAPAAWEYVGIAATVFFGVLTVAIAVHVFFQQVSLGRTLERRIFGTLTDFQEVYAYTLKIIREANERPESQLAIMAYWLWFGSDREVFAKHSDPEIRDLGPSAIRDALQERMTRSYNTQVIVYDPTSASVALKEFITAVMKWHIDRRRKIDPNDPGVEKLEASLSDRSQLDDVVARYREDLAHLEGDRSSHTNRNGHTAFERIATREHVPMLMFAGKDPSGWRKSLVYFGETPAIASLANTGGFASEEPKLVDIIFDQIRHQAEGKNGGPKTLGS